MSSREPIPESRTGGGSSASTFAVVPARDLDYVWRESGLLPAVVKSTPKNLMLVRDARARGT
jgi:hypothetical protein